MSAKIGNDAAVLTFSKVLVMAISLVTNMLLSRFCTVEEYGTFSQLNLVITLSVSFLLFGLPSSTNYFLALSEKAEQRRHFLSIYYTLTTILSFIIGLLLVLLEPAIESYFNNSDIHFYWYFLFLYPLANVTIAGISNVLVVYGKSKKLMLINSLTALVSFIAIIIVSSFKLTFRDYLWIYIIGNIALTIYIYAIVYNLEGGLKISFDLNLLKEIVKYSIPIGLASLVGTINIELDKLMIGRLMDTESLAYYTNAGKELPLVFIASSLSAVLLPQMVRDLKHNETHRAVSLWGDTVMLSFIFICFFSVGCAVFAPQAMTFLYSEKYLPGVSVFIVYSFVLLLRVTYFGMVLNAVGQTRVILLSSVVALVANIILNFALYYTLGFIGPALATFFSILLVNLFQLKFTAKILKVPFKDIFPWKGLLSILFVNILWGSIAYLCVRFFKIGTSTADVLICIIAGATALLVYLACLRKRIASLWYRLNN